MYIDVIIPLAIPEILSYSLEQAAEPIDSARLTVGSLVAVAIGKKKVMSAIVMAIHDGQSSSSLKPILSVIDYASNITPKQLEFWQWLAAYYIHPLGVITHYMLPPSLKLSTEMVEDQEGVRRATFQKIYGFKSRGYISLTSAYNSSEQLEELKSSLRRSKAKLKVLDSFEAEAKSHRVKTETYICERRAFTSQYNLSATAIREMIGLGVFKVEERATPEEYTQKIYLPEHEQNPSEHDALLENKPTLLIKTPQQELWQGVVERELRKRLKDGGEALILTPSPIQGMMLYEELSQTFGEVVMHIDKQDSKERQHVSYNKILHNEGAMIVVGGRKSLALPFNNLKLVVVIDEHEASYKGGGEYDISFNGRDAAIYLAHIHGAKSILTSLAPSIESYHNCMIGKYALLEQREQQRASIIAIDRTSIAPDQRKRITSSSERRFISTLLLEQIDARIKRGEMSFLYQNRKGFATVVECKECGEYIKCDNCNVNLSYHKSTDSMVCRYCSTHYKRVTTCKNCGSQELQMQGIGTENVEDRIARTFPLSRVVRIDSETIRDKRQYDDILEKIERGEVDIIVGTELFTKFKTLDKLTLIGVVNGDNMFAFPEYFTSERAFQSITSLLHRLPKSTGRAKGEEPRMIAQMSSKHPVYRYIKDDDYHSFYLSEIAERRKFLYPPFCNIITFTLKSIDMTKLEKGAFELSKELTTIFGRRCSGVYTPQVDKIRREYIMQIAVKIEKGADIAKAKDIIREVAKRYRRKMKIVITST